ncbi:hypothetical protein [Brenneria tiliae]|uniref:Uncharacterized protein n=1 Tax=Brenneria tiliae TaxID=2914984 RepID=A0ABT0MZR8_9GAMM|nr:hypothetical protein [Brenneria tiliae]MCL2895042.1 hypothetical protein [Brenneria tiliae]
MLSRRDILKLLSSSTVLGPHMVGNALAAGPGDADTSSPAPVTFGAEWRRLYIVHHLNDFNDLPVMERWFWRNHAPEVMRGSRLNRYVAYRAVPPPDGALEYGFYNYVVHEDFFIYLPSAGLNLGNGGLSMTPEPAPLTVAVATVGGTPTNDFLGTDATMFDTPLIRWMTFFKYPHGVPIDECEDWYINAHAKETLRQKGLKRFFSYRTIPEARLPPPVGGQKAFTHPQTRLLQDWDRISELWYENANGWRQSVVIDPPHYTPPPWATDKKYPFFHPASEFISTFILERPTDDYLRDLAPFYI